MVVVAEVGAARVVETAPVVATAAAAVTAVAIPVQGWGLSAPRAFPWLRDGYSQLPKPMPMLARLAPPMPVLLVITLPRLVLLLNQTLVRLASATVKTPLEEAALVLKLRLVLRLVLVMTLWMMVAPRVGQPLPLSLLPSLPA
jgi:hypothetical protein